jgi:hypothetical protein
MAKMVVIRRKLYLKQQNPKVTLGKKYLPVGKIYIAKG